MEHETSEQIKTLALSLKSMHLVATMDEALARAKDIILGAKSNSKEQQFGEQPLKNVLKSEEKTVNKTIIEDVQHIERTDVTLDNIKNELSKIDERQQKDTQTVKKKVQEGVNFVVEDVEMHKDKVKDVLILKEQLAKKKQALEDVKEFVNMADEVQKK